MTLDKQSQAFLELIAASGLPPYCEMDIQEAREAVAATINQMGIAKEPVADIHDIHITNDDGRVRARVYRQGCTSSAERLPCILVFHGGGFVTCNLETHDSICRYLCCHTGACVISVAYHLAPEAKFPAAFNDCCAVLQWVYENNTYLRIDPNRIILFGDSAGGNLVAAVSLKTKQAEKPMVYRQILAYPWLDMRPDVSYQSHADLGGGEYSLSMADLVWMQGAYLDSRENISNPFVSPLAAEDLSLLPPALIITAGFDPLRDEGHRYAELLSEAGVTVTVRCFDTTIHGFLTYAGFLDTGCEGLDYIADYIKSVF